MKAGERVDHIKEIAERLSSGEPFDRGEVDLVLDQFGFESSAYWGDPLAYVRRRAGAGSDEQLVELSQYLNPPPEVEATSTAARAPQIIASQDPWQSDDFHVFLSHCTSHVEIARRLKNHLGERDIETFVAHESIQVSQEWEDVLQVGLRTCDAVIALLTPNFKESDWTNQEIGIATAHGKIVVPLRFGSQPHGFFAKYQALTLKDGDQYREIARKLFEALVRHELTMHRMAEVLVRKFIKSGSFEEVRARFVALKMVPDTAWTPTLATSLREACEANGEIQKGEIEWRPAPDVVDELLQSAGL